MFGENEKKALFQTFLFSLHNFWNKIKIVKYDKFPLKYS